MKIPYVEYPLPWTVEDDNDTGPNDDYFVEWWAVIAANGECVCRCDTEIAAKAILAASAAIAAALPAYKP